MSYVQNFPGGFQTSMDKPLDYRAVVDDISSLEAIVLQTAYKGLVIFDKATEKHYKVIANPDATQANLEFEVFGGDSTSQSIGLSARILNISNDTLEVPVYGDGKTFFSPNQASGDGQTVYRRYFQHDIALDPADDSSAYADANILQDNVQPGFKLMDYNCVVRNGNSDTSQQILPGGNGQGIGAPSGGSDISLDVRFSAGVGKVRLLVGVFLRNNNTEVAFGWFDFVDPSIGKSLPAVGLAGIPISGEYAEITGTGIPSENTEVARVKTDGLLTPGMVYRQTDVASAGMWLCTSIVGTHGTWEKLVVLSELPGVQYTGSFVATTTGDVTISETGTYDLSYTLPEVIGLGEDFSIKVNDTILHSIDSTTDLSLLTRSIALATGDRLEIENTTVWTNIGTGNGAPAWSFPRGIAVENGNVYVTDIDLDQIWKYDGTTWTNIGTGNGAPAWSFPRGIAVENGNVYVTDLALDQIWKYDGTTWTNIGTGNGAPAWSNLYGIAVENGNVYVTDIDLDQILKLPVKRYFAIGGSIKPAATYVPIKDTTGMADNPLLLTSDAVMVLDAVNSGAQNYNRATGTVVMTSNNLVPGTEWRVRNVSGGPLTLALDNKTASSDSKLTFAAGEAMTVIAVSETEVDVF